MKRWIEKCFLFLRRISAVDSKAQFSMEFLATYGWAILAAIVAIIVLTQFGVFKAENFLPEACLMTPGIDCLDFKIETSVITLVFQNNLGSDITISRTEVTDGFGNSCFTDVPLLLEADEKALVYILGCNNGNVGDKFKGEIGVTYTKIEDYSLSRIIKGTVTGKIITESATSSLNICQNAETGGLCPGLDILFGTGYQAACCSEHSLCC